jgi:hypothetical protein
VLVEPWAASIVHIRRLELLSFDCNRCVRVPWNLADQVNDIHPKAIDTLIKPKPHNTLYFADNSRIVPVKVWLLRAKEVEIVFLSVLIVRPCASYNVAGLANIHVVH